MPASKKSAPVIRNLEREAEAAKVLLANMADILGQSAKEAESDDALTHDMIEGETDLLAAIDSAVELIAMDQAHIDGLKELITTITERANRKAARVEVTKSAILAALEMAGLPRHEGALATVGTAKLPAKLIVTEESQIDSRFFVTPPPPPPQLDKRALLAYLKERAEGLEALADLDEADRAAAAARVNASFPAVSGAELSNGGTRLNLRFK